MALESLTIQYLSKCNLRCEHCVINASPDSSDKIGLKDAKNWIRTAKDCGAKDIYLCGGEPFLVFEELCELAKHSNSLDLRFNTYSNAFWARSLQGVREYLLPLQRNGLNSLKLSLDCFHMKEGVPLENLLNAASVANDIKLNLAIEVTQTKRKELSYNFIRKMFRNYKVHFEYDSVKPFGRAASLNKNVIIKEKKDNYKRGCRNYANPLISPKGKVFACGGAYLLANEVNPLYLGNAYHIPLSRLIEKSSHLKLLHLVATFGPYFIYELINSKERLSIRGSTYVCEFCCKLLNSEENVSIINEKMENPDSDLKIKLGLAELSYKNVNNLRVRRFNSQLVRFCRYRFPSLWRFIRMSVKSVLDKRFLNSLKKGNSP